MQLLKLSDMALFSNIRSWGPSTKVVVFLLVFFSDTCQIFLKCLPSVEFFPPIRFDLTIHYRCLGVRSTTAIIEGKSSVTQRQTKLFISNFIQVCFWIRHVCKSKISSFFSRQSSWICVPVLRTRSKPCVCCKPLINKLLWNMHKTWRYQILKRWQYRNRKALHVKCIGIQCAMHWL